MGIYVPGLSILFPGGYQGIPASPTLGQNFRICDKNKTETKFVKSLSYLKARCTKAINLNKLKSDLSEIIYYYFVHLSYLDVKNMKRIKTCSFSLFTLGLG